MPPKLDATLLKRLEAATGEDPACCAADLQAEARAARKDARFDATLARAKALSDEGRLLALWMLRGGREMCGCEVQAALGVTHATVSHHMAVLLDAGLVESEKRGKWTYYRLTSAANDLLPRGNR